MGEDIGRKPISTGPYLVDEWRSGESIVLKKNPTMRGRQSFFTRMDPPTSIRLFTES